MLEAAWDGWRQEDEAVTEELEVFGGWPPKGEANPAQLALSRQRMRLRREYLLRELVSRRFLPGYGFPTDVVPFINTNIDDLKAAEAMRKRLEREAEEAGGAESEPFEEDRLGHQQEYPSRSRDIAMREYAPGADLVIGGKVFQSRGVTLSWHIPPSDTTVPEVQALRWAWSCEQCGGTGTHQKRREECPACGEATSFRQRRYLIPAGFAVSISSKPHGDLSKEQYIPVIAPWISVGGAEWSALSDAMVGRHRYGPDGEIFQGSSGITGNGYAVCLRCGFADSEPTGEYRADTLPEVLGGHRPLRGGKQRLDEGQCVGTQQEFAIQRGLWLGQSSLTDVYELQLMDPGSGRALSETEAYSLGVALRQALAEKLGIDDRELGVAAAPSQYAAGTSGYSILLFDKSNGGAGYVASAPGFIAELLMRAREILQCSKACDKACHRCLLSYDTQHQHLLLDRQQALTLLDSGVIEALKLPEHLHYFGDRTRFEYLPISTAVRREVERGGASSVTLFLAGDTASWDLDGWALKRDVLRWLAQELTIYVVIPERAFTGVAETERQLLAGWVRNGVRLLRCNEEDTQALATVGGASWTTRWATTEQAARTASRDWGRGEDGTSSNVVVGVLEPFEPPTGTAIRVEELTPGGQGWGDTLEVTIRGQMDGSMSTAGTRFWERLTAEVAELKRRLTEKVPLSEVRYTDRYIRSPLNARLLFGVLDALKDRGVSDATRYTLQTAEVRRDNLRYPRVWGDDWNDRSDQESVLNGLLSLLRGAVEVQIVTTRELTHARELVLLWEDGATWELRLDQGLSFLEAARREDFPFAVAVDAQVSAIRTRSFNLRRRDQGTIYLYAKQVGI